MKAITIIQPWATLIAIGAKKFETRGWATKHRGALAIHAGKKVDREACEREPIKSVLEAHGYSAAIELPTGKIVATCFLEDCWEVIGEENFPEKGIMVLSDSQGARMFGITRKSNEFHFGFYSKGRFAWELSHVKAFPNPISAKGMQRLWNWYGSR